MPEQKLTLFITCEHAVNRVPQPLKDLIDADLLNTHRGLDFGAAEFAVMLQKKFRTPYYDGKVSRLVADLNRSPDHKNLFGPGVCDLPSKAKKEILNQYYYPYRREAEKHMRRLIQSGKTVLHLSVHSFTPFLNGKTRTTDIGILFDPARSGEAAFAAAWRKNWLKTGTSLKMKFNYPYRGTADGFTTYLRKRFRAARYLGIELEMNQKYPLGQKKDWRKLQNLLLKSLPV